MSISSANPTVATYTRYVYTATGGETSISGADSNGLILAYTIGKEQVFLNGTLLVRGSDYTATTGTSITGLTALVASDIVEILIFTSFSITDAIVQTTVDAKGDLLVGSAADSVSRLAVGNSGETLVADSSTTTGLRWLKTCPNYAVNGAFDYWQRGTSFTVTSTAAYTADRFYCYAAGANATAARSTSVPTGSIAPYSLEFTGATSQTLLEIGQRIESQYVNALKTTVTFSARVFNNTGAAFTPTIYIQSPTAVDNWAGITTNVNNVSLQSCPDNAWTTVYYTADWSGYTNISNGVGVLLEFGAAANGASKKIRITEWQVTPTPMIMPFQRSAATLAGELAACQRYYWRNTGGSTYSYFGTGNAPATTSVIINLQTPVRMRVEPTSVEYSGLRITDATNGLALTSITIDSAASGPDVVSLAIGGITGATQFRLYYLQADNSATAYLGLSAEL